MEISGEQKIKIIRVKQIGDSFVSQTPEKKSEISLSVLRGRVAEIPEKYLVLSELFDRMVCSIRLLSLRKRSTTFHNIRIQVEILTGRNFEYRNLAQMKYILPEALKIKKVLVDDKKALCRKPEIYIMLVHDIVGSDHEQSVYVALSDLFTARIRNFHRKHPEVSDIPEAELPEPFNEKHTPIEEDLPNMGLSMPTEADLSNSSHTRSSQKSVSEAEETTQELLSYPSGPPHNVINLANRKLEDNISPSPCFETDVTDSGKLEHCTSDIYTREIKKGTPLKLASDCSEITLETPAQPTPKRSSSCQNKHTSVMNDGNINSLSAKRSLMFSRLEDEELNDDPSKNGTINASIVICQDDLTELHQSSTCLSEIVPVISQIFKSVGWRPITKELLIHKILDNCFDIDEKGYAERQVELLENLVPDWIYKESTLGGDCLYSINKISDLGSILETVSSSNLNVGHP